jgi:hypothetical protein
MGEYSVVALLLGVYSTMLDCSLVQCCLEMIALNVGIYTCIVCERSLGSMLFVR